MKRSLWCFGESMILVIPNWINLSFPCLSLISDSKDSRPSHWASETCGELPTLDIWWARYKLVMQGMHENFLQTWWHYTSFITLWLPYKKNLQIALHAWVNTHCFWNTFFHANKQSRFAQMTAKCYGSKILINLLMKSEDKCFMISIYLSS